MGEITEPVRKLTSDILMKLSTEHDLDSLQSKSSCVDVILGCDYIGLHPKPEEASCGDHLSIMSGEASFFKRHSRNKRMGTICYFNLIKIHNANVKVEKYSGQNETHPLFSFIQTPMSSQPTSHESY